MTNWMFTYKTSDHLSNPLVYTKASKFVSLSYGIIVLLLKSVGLQLRIVKGF